MGIFDDLGGVLQQYRNGAGPANPQDAMTHYQQAASETSPSILSGALQQIFRSPQTGTFGQNVSSMFGQSNPNQRAGILNVLLSSGVGGGLASMLGLAPGTTQVSPQQAQQIQPAVVEQAANHAQNQNPSIVDRASEFYSQHPTLVQALGTGAAIMAVQHILNNR